MSPTRVSVAPSAVELEYRLMPRWWQALLVGGGFGVGALFVRDSAPILAALCGALSLAVVVLVVAQALVRQHVRITPDHVVLPRSRWSTQDVALRFARTSIVGGGGAGSIFIDLREDLGKTYTVWRNMLPSDAAFEQVCNEVRARIDAARR
jgi:hypothetical protein